VQTGVQDVDEAFLRELDRADIPTGRYVFLTVQDTGPGMDEPTKVRIFDPFFSTKFAGRGLGLAAVAGIVSGHKGAIQVTSAPGRGTSFLALFPQMESQVSAEGPSPEEAQERLDVGGAVLVVDDEAAVRTTIEGALQRRGCDVLAASSGPEALEILKHDLDRISLVLLDLSMPGMSGHEVLPKLLALKPNLKVVVTSGYTEADARRLFTGMPVAGFIEKPYTVERLTQALRVIIRRSA
jgi:CheY-like chemotaxis protein